MQEENVLNITFPTLLKRAMISKSLLQKDLSLMTGITHSAISKYLSGKALPRAQELVKLSSVLGVSTDYLLGIAANTTENNALLAENVALKAKLKLLIAALKSALSEVDRNSFS